MARSESTIARINLSSDSRERVLAEGALQGEKVVAYIRAVMFFLRGAAFAFVYQGASRPEDPIRRAVIIAYAGFCLAVVALLFWKRVTSTRAFRFAPDLFTLVDCLFVVAMGMRAVDYDHESIAESGATNLALIVCFSLARFSRLHLVTSTVLACASYLFVASYGGELSGVQTTVVIASLLALGALIGWANTRISKMFLDFKRREVLAGFLPKQVVDRAMSLDSTLLDPVQRDVTLLFTDIRDFTKLSEHMPPKALLSFLDDYFARLSQIVQGHDGVVNKFLGDGMLAVWGVPDQNARHPEAAVRAALDIRKAMLELNAERARAGLPPLKMGMGVHTGPVAAGMMGGTAQHEYTVIGDSVNLASRIESLTKAHGVDLLISDSTYRALEGRLDAELAAEEKVKGREQPVVVYAVRGFRPADASAGETAA